MPGTTTPRNYPYPLDPDPIDVAGDIKRLAEAIDDDMVAALAAASKIYASTTEIGTSAPRVAGNVVLQSDGSQWLYDGTKWVCCYQPPGAWTQIALNAPITHLGSPPGAFQVRTNNNYCEFRGGAHIPALGTNGGAMGFMPANIFPEIAAVVSPGLVTLSADGAKDLWALKVNIPNNSSSYISAGALATSAQPWYGDADISFSGLRLWMAPRTIA